MTELMTSEFWKDVAERAIATFLQTVLGMAVVDTAAPIWSLDWQHIIGAGITAAAFSVAKSVLAGVTNGTPSVGDVEVGKKPKPGLSPDPIEDGPRP